MFHRVINTHRWFTTDPEECIKRCVNILFTRHCRVTCRQTMMRPCDCVCSGYQPGDVCMCVVCVTGSIHHGSSQTFGRAMHFSLACTPCTCLPPTSLDWLESAVTHDGNSTLSPPTHAMSRLPVLTRWGIPKRNLACMPPQGPPKLDQQ